MTTSNSSSSASSPAAASSSRPLQAQSQPNAPSGLRHAESPPSSPEAQRWRRHEEARAEHVPEVEETGVEPYAEHGIAPETSGAKAKGVADEPFEVPTARTRLLQNEHKYHIPHDCGSYECDHGTMSPRPLNTQRYGSFAGGYFGGDSYSRASPAEPAEEEERGRMGNLLESALGKAVTNKLLGKPGHDRKGSTAWLAETHGLGDERWLYVRIERLLRPAVYSRLLIRFVATVGTSSTTSLSRTGYGSIAGRTCEAISSRLSRWLPSISPWLSRTHRILAMSLL